MSRPLDTLLQALLRALSAMLFALGLGLPLLIGAQCVHFIPRYIALCALIVVILSLAQLILPRLHRNLFFYLFLLVIMIDCVLLFFERGFLHESNLLLSALSLSESGISIALYGDVLCRQLAVYATLVSFFMTAPYLGMVLPFTITSIMLFFLFRIKLQAYSVYMLFCLPALAITAAATHTYALYDEENVCTSPRIGGIAAVFLALSLLFAPAEGTKFAPLANWVEDLRQAIHDRFFFQEERARYTLASDGWMPLGEMRLGGKPTPHNKPIMMVETAETVYLRATAMDVYTGSGWYDSLSDKRYYWSSSRNRDQRSAILQEDYPLVFSQAEKSLRVQMLAPSASTLFVPQRLRSLDTEARMDLYFNAGSEIFASRNLAKEDKYSLTYLSMLATDPDMPTLCAQNANVNDPAYPYISETYLALPSHLQKEVHQIVSTVTFNCETPWQKAVALRDYLKYSFPYTLDVEDPPENVDFVAWFLLAERKGYCAYYATAMTVLCRLAGLPARYVQGYVAHPNAEGLALVTGENAHAWTEVYFNGLGWVTFDATASEELPSMPPERPENHLPQSTPSPTPSLSPSSAPTDHPSPAPESSPDAHPGNAPSDAPTQSPDAPAAAQGASLPWLWLLLLIALLLLLAWRIRVTDPLTRIARMKNDNAAFTLLWLSMLENARALHFAPKAHETPLHYAARVKRDHGFDLRGSAAAYCALKYGKHNVSALDLQRAAAVYRALQEKLNLWQKLRLSLKCAFRVKKI